MLWVIVWQLDRLYTSLGIEIRLPLSPFFLFFSPSHLSLGDDERD